jgi:pyruvate kinase
LNTILNSCAADWFGIRVQLDNFNQLGKGNIINFKDGLCKVEVKDTTIEESGQPYLECIVTEVDDSFLFIVEQGANPQNYLFGEILTEKDIQDLAWGLTCGFDVISVSFVCSPLEAFQVRHEIRKFNDQKLKRFAQPTVFQPTVFAKIETRFAIDCGQAHRFADHNELDNWERYGRFCEAFDGVMVARGDLAVEANKYDVPSIKRRSFGVRE